MLFHWVVLKFRKTDVADIPFCEFLPFFSKKRAYCDDDQIADLDYTINSVVTTLVHYYSLVFFGKESEARECLLN